MRKFLISLMAASMLAPATAYARPDDDSADRTRNHAAKQERSSDDRPQRAERPVRVERSEPAVRMERQDHVRVERPDRPVRVERVRPAERPAQEGGTVQVQRTERPDQVRQVRRSDRNPAEGIRAIARRERGDGGTEARRGTDGSLNGIPSTSTRRDRSSDRHHRWSSDWRRDHRYDWRHHRSSHRSLFRLGRYYDPYGWGYRRFSIGFSLGSSYYGSNYWLDDPWMYRLPPAYGPYRWVRYYDDALLVNIYTGQVVDVLYSFFW